LDGFLIDAHHLGRLKGAIDIKLNIQDLPPHLSNMAPASARFSLFVEAIQEEEDKFVWGAVMQLESEVEEADGLVTTRIQERKETAKRADKKKKWGARRLDKRGREEQQKCINWHINGSPRLQNQKCHSKSYNKS